MRPTSARTRRGTRSISRKAVSAPAMLVPRYMYVLFLASINISCSALISSGRGAKPSLTFMPTCKRGIRTSRQACGVSSKACPP